MGYLNLEEMKTIVILPGTVLILCPEMTAQRFEDVRVNTQSCVSTPPDAPSLFQKLRLSVFACGT